MVAVISEPQSEEASKDLKVTEKRLEMKIEPKDENKEILEAQEVIDETIVANSDAIKRIDKEIEEMAKSISVSNNLEETVVKGTGHDCEKQERK